MSRVGLDGMFSLELPEGWEATELEDRPGYTVATGSEERSVSVAAIPTVPVPPEEVLNQVVSGLVGAEVLEEQAGERPDGLPTASMLLRLEENLHRAHVITGPSATVVVLGVHKEADEGLAEPLSGLIASLEFEEDDTYVAEVVLAALEDHHPKLSFTVAAPDRIDAEGKDGVRAVDLSDLIAKVNADPESEADLIADFLESKPLG